MGYGIWNPPIRRFPDPLAYLTSLNQGVLSPEQRALFLCPRFDSCGLKMRRLPFICGMHPNPLQTL